MDIDLSQYVRVGRFDLPEPTRTSAPINNLLAQEASAITYNWDTDTLFVVGDGGTSIVQIDKQGNLINTMTLAQGSSPQGTEFYDTEGLTYIGNGQFVMTEERDRNAVLFTYQAGTTLTRANAQTAHLGTNVGNIGLEGLSYDPQTGGFIFAKEKGPEGIFQTTIDFANDIASNGSATTVNSTDLFNPAGLNLVDIADIYAMSNIASTVGVDEQGNLLVLSQESGKILEVDRAGNVLSSLTIQSDPAIRSMFSRSSTKALRWMPTATSMLSTRMVAGTSNHPQIWVYAPASAPNQAPTVVNLINPVTSMLENTSTSADVKGRRPCADRRWDRHKCLQPVRRRCRPFQGRQHRPLHQGGHCPRFRNQAHLQRHSERRRHQCRRHPRCKHELRAQPCQRLERRKWSHALHLRSSAVVERQQCGSGRLVRIDQQRHERRRYHRLEDGRQFQLVRFVGCLEWHHLDCCR
jgi:uncharacterized protein YjiK